MRKQKLYSGSGGICLNVFLRMVALVCCLIVTVGVQAYAQEQRTLTAEFKDTPLAEVLKKLEKLSSYKILFTYDDVQNYKVTASLKDVTITEALQKVLADKPFSFSDITGGKYISVVYRPSEKFEAMKTIKGQVVDDKGESLIGATIRVVRSSTGTVTDIEGRFTLRIPASVTALEVTFIGMKTLLVPLQDKTEFHIVMQPDNTVLSDVVVTGYQTISRERSAGAYDIVKGETISDKVGLTGDILQSMEGLTAGLSVNLSEGADTYVIRGITSINSNRSPLFVVDGVPLESSQVQSLLNGNDISSITVLKDATAASIWGSQAANGVVVITTKKGSRESKLKISYDGSFAYTGKPDYDYQHKMGNALFLKNVQEMFDQYSTVYPYETVKNSVSGLVNGFNPLVLPHERIMYRYQNNEIGAAERDQALAQLMVSDGRKDYEKYFMSNKLMTRHTLSFSGGSDKQNFYLSLGYVGDQGISKDWQDRVSVNARQEYTLAPWLKWDITVNASYGNKKGHLSPWKEEFAVDKMYAGSTYYTSLPYAVFYDAAGQAIDWSEYAVSAEKREQVEGLTGIDMSFYPVEEFNSTSSKTVDMNLRLNTGLSVDLIHGLRYEGRVQYSRFHSKTENYYPGTLWKLREERLCATPASTLKCPLPSTGGNFILDNALTSDWTVRNQLTYNNEFSEGRHQLTALLGTEIREYKNTVYSNFLRGYDMHTMQYTPYDDYNLNRVSGAVFGGSVNNFNTKYYTQSEVMRRYFSLYANAAYTFNSKYTLNTSLRIDQSNLFGSDPNNQYKPIRAIGGAWKISQESFMQGIKGLNMLSLRATYGFAGNSPEPGQGGSYDILSATSSSFFETNGFALTTPANDKIIWEKTRTWNIGFDTDWWDNRLSLSFDYYNKKTTDLIGTMMLNPVSGWLSTVGNLGTLSNKGFELTINSHNLTKNNFDWYTTFTLSHNVNKIQKLEVETPYTAKTLAYLSSVNVEGYPVNSLFSYRYAGLNKQGEPQAYDQEGNIVSGNDSFDMEAGDVEYSGTTVPKFYGGLTNRFVYKNWELSLMFVYNFGNKMRRDCEDLSYGRPTANLHKDFDKRWRTEGDERYTDIPVWTPQKNSAANYNLFYFSDRNILNASYIKLRDISLSYRLPVTFCRKFRMENVRLILQAGNLFYWAANSAGIDPEYYRLDSYKDSRKEKFGATYSLGLNINF